jgi:hypothetical protein
MSIFSNPFFSIAGQVERISNVGAVLNAAFNPFSKTTVQANVSNPILKTGLETVANHPYIAAGVVAGGAAVGLPRIAQTTSYVASSIVKAHPLTTAAAVVTAPISIPFVANILANPKVQKTIAEAPASSAKVGEDISGLINEPSLDNGIKFVKEHPAFSAAAITAALVAIGYSAVTISQILATRNNTKAINEAGQSAQDVQNLINKDTGQPQVINIINQIPDNIPPINTPSGVVAQPSAAAPPKGTKPKAKKKAKKKAKPKAKKKKKTRRSKKKSKKKKSKTINRRKK